MNEIKSAAKALIDGHLVRLFSDDEWLILEKQPVPTGQNH